MLCRAWYEIEGSNHVERIVTDDWLLKHIGIPIHSHCRLEHLRARITVSRYIALIFGTRRDITTRETFRIRLHVYIKDYMIERGNSN